MRQLDEQLLQTDTDELTTNKTLPKGQFNKHLPSYKAKPISHKLHVLRDVHFRHLSKHAEHIRLLA